MNWASFWEAALFAPQTPLQKLLVFLLSPLGLLTCFFARRDLSSKTPQDYGIAVIGVGNLIVGGTGKTPLTAALAETVNKPAIVLRGYGRESKGLQVVAHNGLKLGVKAAGDEALTYARLLPQAIVIVSADRAEGVLKARALGAEAVFLDDGFRHRGIEKFDILIRPNPDPQNPRCLPAGPYRQPIDAYAMADYVAIEGRDFERHVSVQNPTDRMVLVTAIARPERLNPWLPPLIARYEFPDHHPFDEAEIRALFKRHGATSLLVTLKDAVKLESMGLPLSLLSLRVTVSEALQEAVRGHIHHKAHNR